MGVKTARSNEEYKISAKNRDLFSDFNHSFLPHPNTGQISRKTNVDSVKMALRNLLLTNKYERLRDPEYGGNIRRWLFENLEPDNVTREIKRHIEEMIRNNEPRVRVIEITVTANEERAEINVNIEFAVTTAETNQNLDITLYRVR